MEEGGLPSPGQEGVASPSGGIQVYWDLVHEGGENEREIDRWIGAASAVVRTLKQSVVVKRELSQNASFQFTGQSMSQLSPMVMSSR